VRFAVDGTVVIHLLSSLYLLHSFCALLFQFLLSFPSFVVLCPLVSSSVVYLQISCRLQSECHRLDLLTDQIFLHDIQTVTDDPRFFVFEVSDERCVMICNDM
jgi:hypothetical protein